MTATDNLWIKETTRGTGVYANMYKLGVEPESNEFPITFPGNQEIHQSMPMGTRTATFTKGSKFNDQTNLSFIPVNSAEFFFMLGTDSYSEGVHTITAHATTAKPSRTLFRQGQATTEKKAAVGCISTQLQGLYKLGNALSIQSSVKGMSNAVSTETPTIHSDVFPSAETGVFDVMTTFTANSVAYTIEELSFTIAHNIRGYGNNGGNYRGFIDTEPIILTLIANLKGDITALRTLQDAGTGHTVVFKLSKAIDATKYLQLSTTMSIYDMSDKYMLNDATDRAVVSWIGSGCTVTSKDGHTASW
jgi:hypothetical protein